MTDREALLRTVCENPDDDLPRLVFADWLDEHDEPERAEFIRLQCELHGRMGRHSKKKGIPPAVVKRMQELLRLNDKRWRAELPVIGHSGSVRWVGEFQRGFIAQAQVGSVQVILKSHVELFGSTPLRALMVNQADGVTLRGTFFELLAIQPFRRLRLVSLGLEHGPAGLVASALAEVERSRVHEVVDLEVRCTREVYLELADDWYGRLNKQAEAAGRRFSLTFRY